MADVSWEWYLEGYHNGRTIRSIADELGVSTQAVTKRLRALLGDDWVPQRRLRKLDPVDVATAVQSYLNGSSQCDIARLLGVTQQLVSRELREAAGLVSQPFGVNATGWAAREELTGALLARRGGM